MGIETLPSDWAGGCGKGLMLGRQGKLGKPAPGGQCPVSSTGAGSRESPGCSLPSLRLRVSSRACRLSVCSPQACALPLLSECSPSLRVPPSFQLGFHSAEAPPSCSAWQVLLPRLMQAFWLASQLTSWLCHGHSLAEDVSPGLGAGL